MNINGTEIDNRSAVIDHITGQWAFTPVLARAEWSLPQRANDGISVSAECPGLGAAPSNYCLTFWFNDRDLISRIEEKYSFIATAKPVDHMPAHVRTAINGALANQTPMVLAYVDDKGAPSLSLRGSVQVYSPTQVCLWVRNADSGLIRSIRANRPLSLLYRNSPTRTTLIIRGRGKVIDDQDGRRRVFDMSPEVEQRHDPAMTGAAVVIDVSTINGTSPRGPVLVVVK
jgi:pyridoxamine 5'-phosphate oxidase-like protein